ncbi:MAG: hypothetical protein WC750_03615 [Patescibacteria group bacterium]|jgi:hypothetical protein
MTTLKTYRTLWIVLGIIAIIMIGVLAYGLALRKQATQSQSPTIQVPGLGELGAECGGEKRLPCRPGLNCVKTTPRDATGICQKVSDQEPGKVQPIK